MNFKFQAKILLLLAVILTAAFALTAQSRQVELSPNPNRAALRNNSDLGFDVNYQVGGRVRHSWRESGGPRSVDGPTLLECHRSCKRAGTKNRARVICRLRPIWRW